MMVSSSPPRDALCVALDGSDRDWILDTARLLAPEVGWFKLGLEAFSAHGPRLVEETSTHGLPVFLDVKLHDIPVTVRRAMANCAASGASMITVHAGGGRAMLEAALEGAASGASPPPRVVAVTVLTSLDAAALAELGLDPHPEELVLRWARLAQSCGLDGVVASAREAEQLRAACGPDFVIVTPAIRPHWHGDDDQSRTLGPGDALAAGADILVVGRPITRAMSPVAAARRIVAEMAAALGD